MVILVKEIRKSVALAVAVAVLKVVTVIVIVVAVIVVERSFVKIKLCRPIQQAMKQAY